MIALVVFFAAQLGTMLHMALVQHARCAAHGELVHVGDGHDAHAQVDVPNDAHRGAISQGDAHGDEHDHCGFGAFTPQPMLASAPTHLLPLEPFAAPQINACRATCAHPALRPLDFAPKGSPPVSA